MGKNNTSEQKQPESLESALKRLEEIVSLMDSESVNLEDSIQLFEEGMHLTKYCREQITSTEQRVQKLIEDAQGNLSLEEFES